jgi:hypothetical protein
MSITPQELKDYSEFPTVKERDDKKLEFDILEAETYVEKELGKAITEFTPLPKKLKLALLKVGQFFALVNSDESMVKGFKSEKIGDYSYTLSDGTSMTMPNIDNLISEYIAAEDGPSDKNVFLRMRPI